jgi:5,10-methylenetetrahydromethanopterin reductase
MVEPRSGSLDELTVSLQQAVDDGFSSAWMADIFGLDPSALAYAGSRVGGIGLARR